MTRIPRTLTRAGLLGAVMLLATPAVHAADWGIAARAGTLGLGVDLGRSLTPFFNARIGVNAYDYDMDFESDDVDYEGELELESAHALLDFHPGSPNVDVDSTLGSAYDQQEDQEIEDELEDFDTYPVINAGLVFRF